MELAIPHGDHKQPNTTAPDVYPDRKFVRVTEERSDGFIAFDFAISEPELFVELLLTRPAFEEFCRTQNVIRLDGALADSSGDAWAWRLRDSAVAGLR